MSDLQEEGDQRPTEGEIVDFARNVRSRPDTNQARESAELYSGELADRDIEQDLSLKARELADKDLEQDISLKKTYAIFLLVVLVAQLLFSDVVFFIYAYAGAHWHLSVSVIDVWLSATFVEVVGIALVVTRYLFPRRDR